MLHILQRIDCLRKFDKIDDDLIDYFEPHFKNGNAVLELFNLVFQNNTSNDLHYKDLLWWVNKKMLEL